jgi:hypothetical protein
MSASPATGADADVLVTAVGYAQLCAELEALRTVSRREMREQLRDVREEGDPDSPLLFDLLEEQAQLEGRIALLEAQVAAARIVGRRRTVQLGSAAACACGTATAARLPSTSLSGRSNPMSATVVCRSTRRSVEPSLAVAAAPRSPSRRRGARCNSRS